MNVDILEFSVKGDDRGQLVAIEAERSIPFPIRRAYYIFGTLPGVRRGRHAHHVTRQMAICVRGSCTVDLHDGTETIEILLDRPNRGLLLEPRIWHELYAFSTDAVVVVFADQPYDEADYIRSYDEFKALVCP